MRTAATRVRWLLPLLPALSPPELLSYSLPPASLSHFRLHLLLPSPPADSSDEGSSSEEETDSEDEREQRLAGTCEFAPGMPCNQAMPCISIRPHFFAALSSVCTPCSRSGAARGQAGRGAGGPGPQGPSVAHLLHPWPRRHGWVGVGAASWHRERLRLVRETACISTLVSYFALTHRP